MQPALALFALCLISLPPLVQAEDRNPIEPFEAGYGMQRGGVSVGEARLQLQYQGKDRYRMRADLHLTGLAQLVSAKSVHEEVQGELVGGVPRPLTYQSQRGGKKARTVSLRFEWARAEVAVKKNGEETILTLQPRTVDPLSLHLLVMLDLRSRPNAAEYSVVSGDRLKTYRTRLVGKATTKTPLGEFETLMVSRQRPDSNKVTTYRHAPELGFLPVQISKAEGGKEVARLTIKELRR